MNIIGTPIDYANLKHRLLYTTCNNPIFNTEIDNTHRYEITITFNPKWYSSNQDMLDHIPEILKQLRIKSCSPLSNFSHCYFNYVTEYQKNGAPHVHATLIYDQRLNISHLTNWEQFFKRLYGKTSIFYTGKYDKIHTNDHYVGTWSNYLKKDNPENYFEENIQKNY